MNWPRCRATNGTWLGKVLTDPADLVDRCERRRGHLGRHRVYASAAQLEITGGLNYSKEWDDAGVWWVPRDERWSDV